MILHREELCAAATGFTLTLDELEFAEIVTVAKSAEEPATTESVFAGRALP